MRTYSEMSRRLLSPDTLKRLYQEKLRETGQPLIVYIDTPFCMQICKFCNCRPYEAKCGGDEYIAYYKYLINSLEFYKDLFLEFPPKEVYFGGGTPLLMDTHVMKDIFKSIPNFKEIPNKMIEGHPALLADIKVDLLLENKFTYVSLGVQTFDSEVLTSQNRLGFKFERVRNKIRSLQQGGAIVNCDLITYLQSTSKDELHRLREDLEIMRELGPDMISCHYDFYKLQTTQDERGNLVVTDAVMVNAVKRYRSEIIRFVRKHGYVIDIDMQYFLSDESILKSPTLTPPIYLNDRREGHTYSCSGFPHFSNNEIALGIGGYEHHITYGHINTEFNYEIRNVNNKTLIEELY